METTTSTVGCDVGDQHTQVCALDANGRVLERARLRTSRAALRKWFVGRARSVVVIEAGTHSRWIAEELESAQHEVIVANPRQVRLIYAGRKKNDRLDAETLARLARADRQLLSPIQHRNAEAHADLSVLRSRNALVEARTTLINHVRGVSKSNGAALSKCATTVFARRARQALPDALRDAIEPVLGTIEHITRQIASFDKQLEAQVEKSPGGQVLTTISGVGALTAMAFVLTLEDPSRFRRGRDVGAYLGLVPKQRQSGDSDPQLRITKAGDGLVRKLLVQCAHHILGPFGVDSDLRRYGLRLAERGGKSAKKKAVVAVACKLSVLMHRMWVTGEVYEPLRQGAASTRTAMAAA